MDTTVSDKLKAIDTALSELHTLMKERGWHKSWLGNVDDYRLVLQGFTSKVESAEALVMDAHPAPDAPEGQP